MEQVLACGGGQCSYWNNMHAPVRTNVSLVQGRHSAIQGRRPCMTCRRMCGRALWSVSRGGGAKEGCVAGRPSGLGLGVRVRRTGRQHAIVGVHHAETGRSPSGISELSLRSVLRQPCDIGALALEVRSEGLHLQNKKQS